MTSTMMKATLSVVQILILWLKNSPSEVGTGSDNSYRFEHKFDDKCSCTGFIQYYEPVKVISMLSLTLNEADNNTCNNDPY